MSNLLLDEPLRETPIYRSLHRPNLILGGERELVLLSAIFAGGLIVTSLNWVATVFGLTLWLLALPLLRRMAKVDPQLNRIYLRFLLKQSYYPARSRPFCQR